MRAGSPPCRLGTHLSYGGRGLILWESKFLSTGAATEDGVETSMQKTDGVTFKVNDTLSCIFIICSISRVSCVAFFITKVFPEVAPALLPCDLKSWQTGPLETKVCPFPVRWE